MFISRKSQDGVCGEINDVKKESRPLRRPQSSVSRVSNRPQRIVVVAFSIVASIVGIVAMMVVAMMIAVVAMMVVVTMMMIAVPRCGGQLAAIAPITPNVAAIFPKVCMIAPPWFPTNDLCWLWIPAAM
jgi:hypothetical protein